LILCGFDAINAVSDDEKNALRRRKKKKRIKAGSSISGINTRSHTSEAKSEHFQNSFFNLFEGTGGGFGSF